MRRISANCSFTLLHWTHWTHSLGCSKPPSTLRAAFQFLLQCDLMPYLHPLPLLLLIKILHSDPIPLVLHCQAHFYPLSLGLRVQLPWLRLQHHRDAEACQVVRVGLDGVVAALGR